MKSRQSSYEYSIIDVTRQTDRRTAVVALGACLFAAPTLAQQGTRLPRVLWISPGGSEADQRSYEKNMEAKWRSLGWTFGRNLQYDIRRYWGDLALLERHAAELAPIPYDVILAGDAYVVATFLKAGAKQPLVVQVGLQLVESGLAASLARPGGQVTGMQWDQAPEVIEKFPELAKEMLPGNKRFGWLMDTTYPGMQRYMGIGEAACRKLGLTLVKVDASKAEHLEPAFATFAAEGVQAVSVFCSGLHYVQMATINALAAKHKIADLWPVRLPVETGALLSYGPDVEAMYVHSIGHADKILRGAKPGDLPIELPTTYELVINLKRAMALGLTVPRSVRIRATKIIE